MDLVPVTGHGDVLRNAEERVMSRAACARQGVGDHCVGLEGDQWRRFVFLITPTHNLAWPTNSISIIARRPDNVKRVLLSRIREPEVGHALRRYHCLQQQTDPRQVTAEGEGRPGEAGHHRDIREEAMRAVSGTS
jgi:hypothetical protein